MALNNQLCLPVELNAKRGWFRILKRFPAVDQNKESLLGLIDLLNEHELVRLVHQIVVTRVGLILGYEVLGNFWIISVRGL